MDISYSLDPYNTLVVRLGGDWNIAHGPPSADELQKKIASTPQLEKIALDARGLGEWDSSLLTFLIKLKHLCSQRSIVLSCEDLPKGAERLLDLASAVPE
jgi:phospholipid/cholesterol/gamma-HCH transport system permease protein